MDASRIKRLHDFWLKDKNNQILTNDLLQSSAKIGDVNTFEDVLNQLQDSEKSQGKYDLLHAEAYLKSGQLEKARDLYASAGSDEYSLREYGLALCEYLSGNYSVAQDILLSRSPKNNDTELFSQILLIRCYYFLSEFELAHIAGVRLLQRYDSDELSGLMAMLSLDMEKFDEARVLAEEALTINPNQHDGLLAKASLGVQFQEFDQARIDAEKGIEFYPSSGRFWLIKGQIEFVAQELQQSKSTLTKATQLLPGHLGSLHMLGWNNLALGEISHAHDSFVRALELNRNFAENHGAVAVTFALSQDKLAAESAIKKALGLDRQCLSARYAQSLLLKLDGKVEQASQQVEDILSQPSHIDGATFAQLVQRQQGI